MSNIDTKYHHHDRDSLFFVTLPKFASGLPLLLLLTPRYLSGRPQSWSGSAATQEEAQEEEHVLSVQSRQRGCSRVLCCVEG